VPTTTTSRWRWRTGSERHFLPNPRIEILEGSGNWRFADHPDGVGRHVEPFLRPAVAAQQVGVPT
jgi:hypothetical protein